MTPHEAVPISKVVTLGTAIANIVVDMQLRHPRADRPLIDFGVCAVLVPCQLVGTIIGVLLNAVIPEWGLSLTLFLFLVWMGIGTTRKAVATYRIETAEEHTNESEKSTLLSSAAKVKVGDDIQLDALLEHERGAPLILLASLLVMWLIVISSALIKGGSGVQSSEMTCGSTKWWLATLLPMLPCLLFLGYIMRHAINVTAKKVEIGYPFAPGDMKWESWRSLVWPLCCTIAGISSGALGLGGGTITSPLMLQMGLHPKVVAANAAFMILFTASSTSTQYLASGRLSSEYAAWFGSVGLISCFIGHLLVHYLMRTRNVTWHLIAVVALIIIASAAGIGVMAGIRLEAAISSDASIGVRDVCYYAT